jgi:hypothetical protein
LHSLSPIFSPVLLFSLSFFLQTTRLTTKPTVQYSILIHVFSFPFYQLSLFILNPLIYNQICLLARIFFYLCLPIHDHSWLPIFSDGKWVARSSVFIVVVLFVCLSIQFSLFLFPFSPSTILTRSILPTLLHFPLTSSNKLSCHPFLSYKTMHLKPDASSSHLKF